MFQRPRPSTPMPKPVPSSRTYTERAEASANKLTKQIFEIMTAKETNLSVAADVNTIDELLALADNVGKHICVLKTHIDIFPYDKDVVAKLTALAKKHNFVIFEDRKFADIGNTVAMQYAKGAYAIADWSPLTNAHSVPGEGIIEGLKQVGLPKGNGLLLLAEMSSKDNLAVGDYTTKTIKMAEDHADFVVGFITRRVLSRNESFMNFTPGIQFKAAGDNLGQTYISPEEAIAAGTDVIIVGRGIYAEKTAQAQIDAAIRYKRAGWNAYLERVNVPVEHVASVKM